MTVAAPPIVRIPIDAGNYAQGRFGYRAECFVVHTTGGGADIGALDSWFGQAHPPAEQVSAHFGIGRDGTIHQYVDLADTAYANGIVDASSTSELVKDNVGINPNYWTISCELVDGGVPGNHTVAQLVALVKLAAWVFDTVILPQAQFTGAVVDRKHVIGHYEIGSHPSCPSWAEVRFTNLVSGVQAALAAPVPQDQIGGVDVDVLTAIIHDARQLTLPEVLLLALGHGESSLHGNAEDAAHTSFGIYQVKDSVHGNQGSAFWEGVDGIHHATQEMGRRWQAAFTQVGSYAAWTADQTSFFCTWWPLAQGNSAIALTARCQECVSRATTLYQGWVQRFEPNAPPDWQGLYTSELHGIIGAADDDDQFVPGVPLGVAVAKLGERAAVRRGDAQQKLAAIGS